MVWAATDLSGRRFGRLLVVSRAENAKGGKPRWLCACDCGGTKAIRAAVLLRGGASSCGCLSRELTSRRSVTHGLTGTSEYVSWRRMRRYCYTPTDPGYAHYGARGIRMCDRWRESFENFLADMGPRPSPGHTIDRIDNDGDYTPENCRWATIEVQNRNKSSNVFLEHDGRRMTSAEWAREIGMTQTGLMDRIRRGMSVRDALTRPKRGGRAWPTV